MKHKANFSLTKGPEEGRFADSAKVEVKKGADALAADHFDGNLNVKIPKTLYYLLNEEAQQEGVSLDQYIVFKLTR